MTFVRGMDVSFYTPVVDWQKVLAQGIRFVYVRASYGIDNQQTLVDSKFAEHWTRSKAAGLLRGAYHYLKAAQGGKQQAVEFLKIVKPEKGDLPPALDLEQYFNETATRGQFVENAGAFLSTVKEQTGITPIVYSRASFMREKVCQANGAAPPWATRYRVWIAHWTYDYENRKPLEEAGWPPYTFWQYSGEKEFLEGITNQYGVPVPVDFDVFRGTLNELYRLAGLTPPPLEYTILPGDSYAGIAEKFDISLADLLDANPHLVVAGTKIAIPQPGDAEAGNPETPDEDRALTEPATYTVKSGDTLWAIAQKFGVTVKAIAEVNHLADPNLISVGQVLALPK